MILIAFCFFLILFLIFLAILSKILGKIGNAFYGEKGKKIGRSVLWVLLGCFIFYQIAEYYSIKHKVQSVCQKEAGLFIYVTPEQWKEENKDEWDKLAPYENEYAYELAKKMEQININGELYKPSKVINNRVVILRNLEIITKFTSKQTELFLDKTENKILAKWVIVQTSVNRINVVSNYPTYWLTWFLGVKPCFGWSHQFSDLENEYSNQSLIKQTGDFK